MKFSASFPKIYRFQQAKQIRKLSIQIGLASWNRKIYEKLAQKFRVKFFFVRLSQKLPTSRLVTKCKPERTLRNCDMAY